MESSWELPFPAPSPRDAALQARSLGNCLGLETSFPPSAASCWPAFGFPRHKGQLATLISLSHTAQTHVKLGPSSSAPPPVPLKTATGLLPPSQPMNNPENTPFGRHCAECERKRDSACWPAALQSERSPTRSGAVDATPDSVLRSIWGSAHGRAKSVVLWTYYIRRRLQWRQVAASGCSWLLCTFTSVATEGLLHNSRTRHSTLR